MLEIIHHRPGEAGARWVDAVAPTPEEVARLTDELAVPASFVRDSLDPDERSRVETEDGVTFIVLRVQSRRPSRAVPYTTVALGLVLDGERVATICVEDNEVLERLRQFARRDWPARRSHRLFLRLLAIVAESYLTHLDRVGAEVDALETRLGTSLSNQEVLELLKYQKSLIYYQTALVACEALVERLQRRSVALIPAEDADVLDDVLVEVKQARDVATVSANILSEMMDAFASIISNNLNTVMKYLAAVTIVLTLPVAIASFYGMNVGLPLARSPAAFEIIVAMSVAVSAIVALLLRIRGWL